MVEELEMAAMPSSSLPRIPQSVARPSQVGLSSNPLLSAVHATPTRKSTSQSQPSNSLLSVSAVGYGGHLPSSPLQSRRSSGQLFAAVPDSVVKSTSHPTLIYGIQETPVKKRAATTQLHGHPAPSSSSDKENGRVKTVTNVEMKATVGSSQEESIYKSLGWDDADDLDELS
jgi:DNA replication regulator SLD3